MDLAYVDKLAKDNNGVKYLLVRQDLFDRTVDAKGMKTKDTKETGKTFSKMITQKIRPKKISVDQGTDFAGDFKKFCRAEGIEIYSIMRDESSICRTYNTLTQKHFVSLHGGLWVQVYS